MVVVACGSKKRSLEEEEEEEEEDHISRLPDDVLGHIVSLLPTRDGARTQVLSSRWRPVWRSAPLNLDKTALLGGRRDPVGIISGILSSHQGPGRRLSIPKYRLHCNRYLNDIGGWATVLDGWLQSPALHNLQELELYTPLQSTPLPASVRRFSSTLAFASFGNFEFPDGSACRFSALTQLTLERVRISECSLHALLASCPVLETLLLLGNLGFRRFKIVSPTLRRIAVHVPLTGENLQLLVVEEAPCLERLLFYGYTKVEIFVSSAPRLIHFGTNIYHQGIPDGVNITVVDVVPSVKVLALSQINLCLQTVINFIKVFPYMEKLNIETSDVGEKNTWYRKYRKIIGTLDIRLRKIVMAPYRGNTSHVNFAKFFVSNASLLETMRLEVDAKNLNNGGWIDRQHRLLQVNKRPSRGPRLDFVSHKALDYSPFQLRNAQQVHDMSIEPFHRFSFL